MEIALLFIVLLLLVSPLLSIIALIRVVRLERRGVDRDQGELGLRVRALEQRLEQLSRTGGTEAGEAAPVAAPEPSPRVAPSAEPGPPPSRVLQTPLPKTVHTPTRNGLDWETFIASRWLSILGALAVLFSVAFFLKFAFDNNWVGERGRVSIGLIFGTVLIAASQRFHQRGYRWFGAAIAGLGAGTLFLSLYAGWSFYSLLSPQVAFAGMATVTATLVVLSVARRSQSLAILGLVFGFLTPALLSTGRDAQVELFSYLILLNAGMLLLAWNCKWAGLEWPAFAATVLYWLAWHEAHYSPDKLALTLFFLTLAFLQFEVLPALQWRGQGRLRTDRVILALLNPFLFLGILNALLFKDHRWGLTVAVLLLAALHLGLARLASGAEGREAGLFRALFAGMALTLASLAIPIRLEGRWISIAWAIEGGVLVWTGLRHQWSWLRWAGVTLLAVVFVRLLLPIPVTRFLLNPRVGAFAVAAASFGLALFGARRWRDRLSDNERTAFAFLGIALNFLCVWILSHELWFYFGRPELGVDRSLARQLSLSIFWVAWSGLLILLGAVRSSKALRWQGLVLIGITVAKVFLLDLASLERGYRILSFLAVGLVLLAVSFFYQRRSRTTKTPAGE